MKILCLGDSNTYGYDPRGYFGGRYDRCWPELLGEMIGWTVVNLGENGSAVPRRAVNLPPSDRLLVMLGTNDLLQGASAAEVGARMEAFLGPLCRQRSIVLICPPPMQRGAWVPGDGLVRESRELGAQYEALAGRLGIGFVDTRSWSIGLAFDGVHFTEDGHRVFAEKLAKHLI